jgi:hypothetical protein
MKEAMDYAMNHPPGEKVSDPIKIFFQEGSLRQSDSARFPMRIRVEG